MGVFHPLKMVSKLFKNTQPKLFNVDIFHSEPLVFEMMASHWFAQSLLKEMNQTQIGNPIEVRICI